VFVPPVHKLGAMRRWVGVVGVMGAALVATLASSPAAWGGASGPPPKVPQGFAGVVIDEPVWPDPFIDLSKQLDVMVSGGVESVRAVFDWASAQPYKSWADVPADRRSEFVDVGGIPTDVAPIDELVGLAAARGMTVLPVILGAPTWDGQSYPGGTVRIPRTPGPYAAFAKALVERYGPRGTFWAHDPYGAKLPVEMWQVWNEPNILAFWPKQPYYARYVALLRAAHAAIKAADPAAKVVLAGLPNYSWFELARIYGFRGARNLFDAVAVHPYTKTPQGVITILTYVRHVMNRAGDRAKPIFADEISWPSSRGRTNHNVGYDFATTEAGQAQNISTVLPMLARDRVRLGLGGFYYYDWAGLERDGHLAFEFAGLFRVTDGRFIAKPAFDAFRQGTLSIEGCRSKGPLATDCAT
jgi:Glycosyl hydrolase family 53